MKEDLRDFLNKVRDAYEALNNLAKHKLCAPGVKGLKEELASIVFVPDYIYQAFINGNDAVWEKGWCMCGKQNCDCTQ